MRSQIWRLSKQLRWRSACVSRLPLLWLLVAVGVAAVYPASAAYAATAPVSGASAQVTATAPTAGGPQIVIKDFLFGPATLTVDVGTTVTWVNHDDELHTITAADGLFASDGLDSGDVFSYRFTTPGRYTYSCALHPQMTGTIIVQSR